MAAATCFIRATETTARFAAPIQLTVDFDVTATLFDDAVNHGQPEPSSYPGSLGREKRFIEAGLRGLIHAGTSVNDGQLGVAQLQLR